MSSVNEATGDGSYTSRLSANEILGRGFYAKQFEC
jgi:hypothetical protein